MTFVQIAKLDAGATYRVNVRGKIRNLLLRNHKWDEAVTCHTCFGHKKKIDKLCYVLIE